MSNQNWWDIGPIEPTDALRCEAGTGWKFYGSGGCAHIGKIKALCFFRELLTVDQMNTVNELFASGKLINSSYDSWYQFSLIHGLELT